MINADSMPETRATRAANLFRAYRDGDADAMAELVGLLTPILWHTVRAQRVEHETAEDVVQATWLALVRNTDRITDPQAVLQWLIVTAKREAWRAVKRYDRTEPTDFADSDVVVATSDLPEQLVLRTDDQRRLWAHIEQLSERCRALLRVIAFADRPDYAMVAKALGMPVGSIGPTRGRCLAKLRLLLTSDSTWEER